MKENIFSWIGKAADLAIELETELTRRPAIAPDSGGEGELDKCLFLEGWLRDHGINCLERFDAPDARAKGGIRPNLVATVEGSDKNLSRLWIMSHLDVVPPGDLSMWSNDPWTAVVADNSPAGIKIMGRGTEENQQGLVSSVLCALAFIAQGIKPDRTLKLLFAADEEMGSAYGIDWLINNHRELFAQDDMVLIPDSGDSQGQGIEVAEKNLLWPRFVTKGKQTHGSRPDQGINAHLAGSELVIRLHYELTDKFSGRDPLFEPDYSTFQPTKKEANVPNINTIPGEDVFCMDMRVLPQYPAQAVINEIDRIKAEVEEEYAVSIEYSFVQKKESPATSVDAPLVKLLSGAIQEVYAVQAKPIGIGGGTVGAYLRGIGIDCAVWARINDTAHQPDEYALLGNIIGDAKVFGRCCLT